MLKAIRNMNKIFTKGINETFIEFYIELLRITTAGQEHVSSNIIQQGPMLTKEQRTMFVSGFTKKKVKEALWAIQEDKAPGLDGYKVHVLKVVENN